MDNLNENEKVTISRLDGLPFRLTNMGGLVLENDRLTITGIVKHIRPIFKNRIYFDKKIGILPDNEENLIWVRESQIKKLVTHYFILKEEDNVELPFIYHKPIPISEIDFSEPRPMMNPITYELINPELWEDGLHLSPNLMDENLEINMVYEVKDKKVVRVYKSKV